MVFPFPVEPDSPVLHFEDEDEPELDGLRHLSVSTDGTIDSLISEDENPTPPHSPNPTFHVSPPGAPFSFTGRVLEFGDEDDAMNGDVSPTRNKTPVGLATPIATTNMSFFGGAATPITPISFQPAPLTSGNPAARRAATGKLPSKALLSLQQMRFEASGDAGMGLGVGPPSSGLEGISPGGPAYGFRAMMGVDGEKSRPSSPLPSPGIENMGFNGSPTLGAPIPIQWNAQAVNKMPRSPARNGTPLMSTSGDAFKPSLRNTNLRINLSGAAYSPLSSPLSSPVPSSPHVKRSSAFHLSNTGPRTPLTPSHLPGAPSLGGGGAAFDWFAYSVADSPGCPTAPPGAQVAERSCYFSDLAPASPSSSNGTYLPTPGSERARTPFGQNRTIPVSPLRQGRFAGPANPFFA